MQSGERKFKSLYKALNPAQRQAVDAIDGPVMVIAGPGTGKTQVLTLRIANILRLTDTPPDAILALAFTRSAVSSMRQRLVEIVGSVGYRVKIHTFHSFCNEIIRVYPDYFPRIIGATSALPVDQIRLMKSVIDGTRLKLLKPYGAPYYYLYPALEAIDKLKKENIAPADFAKLLRREAKADIGSVRRGGPARNRELLRLYRGYEAALRAARLYDFNDMMMEVIRALEAESEFRLTLGEEHHYFLADEHQDANQGQNELLRLLSSYHDRPNLFIVGDTKQAIFQFQGASLDNFDYFRRRQPTALLITLSDNYRSIQPILDAAGSLIEKSSGLEPSDRAPLRSRAPASKQKITLRVFNREVEECLWLARDIKAKLKTESGLTANRLAVIYRDNRDGEPIVETFEQSGLPFVVESEANILRDIDLRKLLLLFRTIYYFGQDDWLRLALHLDFFAIPPLDVWRLNEYARRSRRPLYELIGSIKTLKPIKLDQPTKLARLFSLLELWKRASMNHNFTDLFGLVLNESGFLSYLLKKAAAIDKLEKLQSFFSEMKNILKGKPDFDLKDFITHLDLLEEQRVPINLKNTSRRDGVRLLTAHKAKGLEFDYVYVVGAYDGHFGRRRTPNLFSLPVRGRPDLFKTNEEVEAIEAERRLFYVALTRGKNAVAVSYAESDDEGRHRLPSQFIEEIDKSLIERVEAPAAEKFGKVGRDHFRPRIHRGVRLTDRAYLNQLFLDRGLSVTALNNYLACPLKYFFNNLLRVTKVQGRELLYGLAAHEALKTFFDRWRASEPVSARALLVFFRRALERQPLSPSDFAPTLEKGRAALGGYFGHYRQLLPHEGGWPRAIINELKIRGVLLPPQLKLTGQIDKIEFLAPGGREVRVVDYKTGRPKSRNEILGKNKNATGDYHRQLVFYKLLLDNYDRGKYRVISGEVDFIEPTVRGDYRKERFELTAPAVGELKELIEKVADEIRSLNFFNHGCDKPSCESCTLWRMMDGRLSR